MSKVIRFNKDEAEIELSRLVSEMEIIVDDEKYPHLSKMLERGLRKSWKRYMKERVES